MSAGGMEVLRTADLDLETFTLADYWRLRNEHNPPRRPRPPTPTTPAAAPEWTVNDVIDIIDHYTAPRPGGRRKRNP